MFVKTLHHRGTEDTEISLCSLCLCGEICSAIKGTWLVVNAVMAAGSLRSEVW
jgi:hypothetical protein